MSSSRESGRHELADRAVFYVDGSLSEPGFSAFEQALGESAELREEVLRVREVRHLVSALPRLHAALPSFEELLQRMDAQPSPGIRDALDRLPRKRVPEDLLERIVARLFARKAGGGRVLRPRAWRSLVASGVAAAALLVGAVGLHGERNKLVRHAPKHGKLAGVRFEFSVVRYVPGSPLHATPAAINGRTYLPRPKSRPARSEGQAGEGRPR